MRLLSLATAAVALGWVGCVLPVRATMPVLDAGCRLVPVVAPATEPPPSASGKAPPGTCFADDTGDRMLPEGIEGCCGALATGKVPAKLKPPLTCENTKMTPEMCAAACLDAFEDKGGVVAIGVEYATECYCTNTWPVEKAGVAQKVPAVAPSSSCGMPCSGDASSKCGGTNFIEVWKVDCGSDWGWAFLLTVLICTTLYVGGGTVYSVKIQGTPPGLEALPHREFWAAARGLVVDGARYTKARVDEARGGGDAGYTGIAEAEAKGETSKSVDPDSPLRTDEKPVFGSDDDDDDDDELVE
jgi:hypothetical protein